MTVYVSDTIDADSDDEEVRGAPPRRHTHRVAALVDVMADFLRVTHRRRRPRHPPSHPRVPFAPLPTRPPGLH